MAPGPAIDAFHDNMADAHLLVALADGLTSTRSRRVRVEVRQRLAEALRVPMRDRERIDVVETDDMWVVLKPEASLRRQDFDDHKAILRQALVAACAATETYLADRVLERIDDYLDHEVASKELRRVPLAFGDWLDVDAVYSSTKKTSGLKYRVLGPWVRQQMSTHPDKVGLALRLLGQTNAMKVLNGHRGVGDTEEGLKRITERRNKIAHMGDRRGKAKAAISVAEVEHDLGFLTSVVQAFERATSPS